jgi:hypothetical protein
MGSDGCRQSTEDSRPGSGGSSQEFVDYPVTSEGSRQSTDGSEMGSADCVQPFVSKNQTSEGRLQFVMAFSQSSDYWPQSSDPWLLSSVAKGRA